MSKRRRRRLGALLVLGAAAGAVLMVSAPAADAAEFRPETAEDETRDNGRLSLREAVERANASPGNDTIHLAGGQTYKLTKCAKNTEDTNASGDLDHTDAANLRIEGNGATIQQTCEDRVLLSSAEVSSVHVIDAEITGGRQTGGSVETAAGIGGGVASLGDLHLENTILAHNEARYGGGAAAAGSMIVTKSRIVDNAGVRVSGIVATELAVSDSEASGNHTIGHEWGPVPVVGAFGPLGITRSEVTDNVGGGVAASSDSSIVDSLIARNDGDDRAYAAAIGFWSRVDGPGETRELSINSSTIAENSGMYASVLSPYDSGVVRVHSSTVSDNTSVFALQASALDLRYATVADNESTFAEMYPGTGIDGVSVWADRLSSFGSVVSSPGMSDTCELTEGTATTGYNADDDDSCGFRHETDQAGVDQIGLRPLGDFDGPTPTRPPLNAVGNRLIDAIPADHDECSGVDQRGVRRPVGDGCDIGAVDTYPRFEPPPVDDDPQIDRGKHPAPDKPDNPTCADLRPILDCIPELHPDSVLDRVEKSVPLPAAKM